MSLIHDIMKYSSFFGGSGSNTGTGGGGGTGGGSTSAPSDWNAGEGQPGHILNRTHYTETVMVEPTFDGDMTGREVIQFDSKSYIVKATPQVVDPNELIGATVAFNMGGTDGEMTITDALIADAMALGVPGTVVLYNAATYLVLILPEDATVDGVVVSAGTWFLCVPGQIYVKSLSCLQPYEKEVVHKIGKKFIVGTPHTLTDTSRPVAVQNGNENVTFDDATFFDMWENGIASLNFRHLSGNKSSIVNANVTAHVFNYGSSYLDGSPVSSVHAVAYYEYEKISFLVKISLVIMNLDGQKFNHGSISMIPLYLDEKNMLRASPIVTKVSSSGDHTLYALEIDNAGNLKASGIYF